MDALRELARQRLDARDAAPLICVAVISWLAIKLFFRGFTEAAITFSVPVPEQCRAGWQGKQLDEPSIKVCQRLATSMCPLSYFLTKKPSSPAVQLCNATAQQPASF